MKRFLIFALLGPTLGFVIAVAVAFGLGVSPTDGYILFVIFAYAFVAGIFPALLAGAVDWYLAPKLTPGKRVLAIAGAGYLLCVIAGLMNRNLSVPAAFMFALVGLVAAAVCSWLSGRWR